MRRLECSNKLVYFFERYFGGVKACMETPSVSIIKRSLALLCGFPFFISMLYVFSFSGWAEENTLIPTVTVSDATTANFQVSLDEKNNVQSYSYNGGNSAY